MLVAREMKLTRAETTNFLVLAHRLRHLDMGLARLHGGASAQMIWELIIRPIIIIIANMLLQVAKARDFPRQLRHCLNWC